MDNKLNSLQEPDTPNAAKGITKSVMVVILFLLCLFLAIGFGRLIFPWLTGSQGIVKHKRFSPGSIADLQKKLTEKGLLEVKVNSKIPAIVFVRYPKGLQDLKIADKKNVFFGTLLPAALIAQEEVLRERNLLLEAVAKTGKKADTVIFKEDDSTWQRDLARGERRRMLALVEKYGSDNARELLVKVNTVPVSILLAQAAIESAWGSSRFALQGNNLYGIWTWDGKGMLPKRREEGKTHKVAAYDDMLEATRAYILMLNKRPAYKKFRELRRQSAKPLDMVEGLLNYSSRRMEYVNDVKNMLKSNRLTRFDSCVLDV